MTIDNGSRDAVLRERAIKRLKKRRDVYRDDELDEAHIQQEMQRLQHR